MKRIRLFLTGLLLVLTSVAYAQSVRVTGTVTDANTGEPVPFASVMVKGTTVGVTTDDLGMYTINAQANSVLILSFVGYETQNVPVNGRTQINVALAPTSESLEDVIIVAYGTVKREAKTGSVTSVKGDVISESPVISVDKMLAGKMAGVQVTAATGQPGANSQIRIRGTSSINASNEPLWVVDGIPVMQGDQSIFTNTSNTMNAINPNDIESITVLKDAAAASVYGSRAANGVILVTTKSGKEGKARFTARAKYGVSRLANDNNFGIMTGPELLSFYRDAATNAGFNPDAQTLTSGNLNPFYFPTSILDKEMTNWMDYFSRMGKMQEYEINAAAGNAKGKFYSSLSYHNSEGIFYGVDYTKFTARVNSDYKLLPNLEIGTRTNLAYTDSKDVAMQALYYVNPAFAGMTILPWTPKFDENGNYNVKIKENSNINPRYSAEYDEQWEKQYRVSNSVFLQWEPIKGLVFKTTDALEGTFGEGRRYWAPDPGETKGTLQSSMLQYVQLTTSNTATYANNFGDHSMRIMAGQEAMHKTYKYYYMWSPDVDAKIPYPNTSTPKDDKVSYSYSAETLMSFFGIADYNYASKYFLQASIRYDGSSLFGSDNVWGLFWSVGASWNIHNEAFMKSVKFINNLKLRGSYGINGNKDIGTYNAYGVYASTSYASTTGMLPSSPENSSLSWEKNNTWNVALDFGLFDRISGSIDVYKRLTYDMLLSKQVPLTSGFGSVLMNIGSLTNQGVELQMEANIINSKDFKWDLGFNIARNKTKLLDLGDVKEMNSSSSLVKYKVGNSFYTYYLKDYYGVNPSNGEALWRAKDPANPDDDSKYILTNSYAKARYVYAGSPEPVFIGGANTSVSWKGITLSVFLELKQGNKVLITENRYLNHDGNQMSMNLTKRSLNYWKQPGDVGVNPKPIAGITNSSYIGESTRWLEDGSYLRLKDVTLSYTLPKKLTDKMKIGGLKFYVSGYNLFTFHDVYFWDPERGVMGMGSGIYPMTKTLIGGLEFSF